MISAHWIHDPIGISTGKQLATIHDLVGFPEELYALQYPAKGNDAISMNIAQGLQAHGIANKLEGQRGLDHGIWIPLHFMHP